jgi:hypothetical protein
VKDSWQEFRFEKGKNANSERMFFNKWELAA